MRRSIEGFGTDFERILRGSERTWSEAFKAGNRHNTLLCCDWK